MEKGWLRGREVANLLLLSAAGASQLTCFLFPRADLEKVNLVEWVIQIRGRGGLGWVEAGSGLTSPVCLPGRCTYRPRG